MDASLKLPDNAGRLLLQHGGLITFPLLDSNAFIEFCKERDVNVDRTRLLRFERLGLFSPIFRVRTPSEDVANLTLPIKSDNEWFNKGWAWDTLNRSIEYCVPDESDSDNEAYYSIFQVNDINNIVTALSCRVHADSFIELKINCECINWEEIGNNIVEYAEKFLKIKSDKRKILSSLCQFISDRYGPQALSDQRTIRIPCRYTGYDRWVNYFCFKFDWEDLVKNWSANSVAKIFNITKSNLKDLYLSISLSQSHCDPLERWYQLLQFISLNQRDKLKGKALLAETMRVEAEMIRLLYKDLYSEMLPPPNEIGREIKRHTPELEIRKDTRRYLEFIVNKFNLNPSPKLVLFVEGQSEVLFFNKIYEYFYSEHPGRFGIEILNLHGVNNATGGKKDRFRAIFRLIDYLHHHQVFTFILLDDENNSARLKSASKSEVSIHNEGRCVTRYERIKVWNNSLEFDNFSDTEIAVALNAISESDLFKSQLIKSCRINKGCGASLKAVYKKMTGHELDKIKLITELSKMIFSPQARKRVHNRPIIKLALRILRLADRNYSQSRTQFGQKTSNQSTSPRNDPPGDDYTHLPCPAISHCFCS